MLVCIKIIFLHVLNCSAVKLYLFGIIIDKLNLVSKLTKCHDTQNEDYPDITN